MRTWKAVKAAYDDLRARYYLDPEPPLRLPPPASDLTFTWTRDPKNLGQTHFDEDQDPYLVEVPRWAGARVVTLILLHELSHMRNPDIDCGANRKWWREECRRLQSLDAFGREGIF